MSTIYIELDMLVTKGDPYPYTTWEARLQEYTDKIDSWPKKIARYYAKKGLIDWNLYREGVKKNALRSDIG